MPVIKLISDLHLEHHPTPEYLVNSLVDDEVDILVVAGDIVNGLIANRFKYMDLLSKCCKKMIYVLGNHDLFFSSPNTTFSECYDFMDKHENTFILENNMVETMGVEFIGATMWYPKPTVPTSGFVDFNHIPGAIPWIFEQNAGTLEFFAEKIHEDSVVITHHMPSEQSTPPEYIGNDLNEFFVCKMDSLIRNKQPKLWLHGHTHTACDYKIGETRVICNPYGYFGLEPNTGFNKDLKITI